MRSCSHGKITYEYDFNILFPVNTYKGFNVHSMIDTIGNLSINY